MGQAARFAVVGLLGAGVDYGVLRLIMAVGGSRYAGRIVSIAAAMVVTWALNRTLTFAAAAPPSWREFGHYAAVALTSSVLSLVIYWIALALGAPTWAAFILGVGLTAVFSFWRYRGLLGKP
jgi:putative flippase GtrA